MTIPPRGNNEIGKMLQRSSFNFVLFCKRQKLADCDVVASSGCHGIKTENGNLCEEWKYELLGTRRKFRKSTVSFANHVKESVSSHETTPSPLEEFP